MIRAWTRNGAEIRSLAVSRLAELDPDELPIDLSALTAPEAAGLALTLPPAIVLDPMNPIGWGVFPPRGAEPILTLGESVIDVYGRQVPGGARGVLGVLFRGRSDRSPVHRVWFRAAPPAPPRMIDVYDDVIEGIESLDRVVPALTGWQIARL